MQEPSGSLARVHADQVRPSLLVLATTVPAQSDDGVPSFVLDLASVLADHLDVTILAPRVRGSSARSTVAGVAIRRFPFFPKRWEGLADDAIMPTLRAEPWRWIEAPFLIGSMLWHAWRMSGRQRSAAIHAHWVLPAGLVALVVSRMRSIPYVVTIHGADAYTLNGRMSRWLKVRVLREAAAVIPVSGEIAGKLEQLAGPNARIESAVPMGVAAPPIGDRERSAGAFLFVGRLAEKKGLSVALRALADLEGARLRIVGDGPEMGELRSQVDELGLDERVVFLGRQPKAKVLDEMAGCCALVIPSVVAADGDTDGTPVVLAEAMSLGTPVIASRLAGLAEFVMDGETGWLVPPGDEAGLRDAMSAVLRDPVASQRMGSKAADSFAASPLDIRFTAQQYRRVLAEVL